MIETWIGLVIKISSVCKLTSNALSLEGFLGIYFAKRYLIKLEFLRVQSDGKLTELLVLYLIRIPDSSLVSQHNLNQNWTKFTVLKKTFISTFLTRQIQNPKWFKIHFPTRQLFIGFASNVPFRNQSCQHIGSFKSSHKC